MYTAVLEVIIYQYAKYERDPMTNKGEIAECRYWKRTKEITKKRQYNNRKDFPRCRQTLMIPHYCIN